METYTVQRLQKPREARRHALCLVGWLDLDLVGLVWEEMGNFLGCNSKSHRETNALYRYFPHRINRINGRGFPFMRGARRLYNMTSATGNYSRHLTSDTSDSQPGRRNSGSSRSVGFVDVVRSAEPSAGTIDGSQLKLDLSCGRHKLNTR
jgi:hypothetical protein